ncbi:hypothetical protein BKA64DRAFT_639059 [Cadophora sp. MPI-SDFR-AT-0126]|nr:hypothetical protein BKA64DRAFT_639059 [Leotiomycetes sp. MPI-SDFR-AT-0126]
MKPRKPREGGGPGQRKWKLDRSVRFQPRNDPSEDDDEEEDTTGTNLRNTGSMLDYLNQQPPHQPRALTTFAPQPGPQARPSQPHQQQYQSQRQSQSQSPLQLHTQWRLPPPPSIVQPNIGPLPPPNIASQLMEHPRPNRRDPTDGLKSRTDRRLLNMDPAQWWNSHPSQHRTNPSSDKCWQCLKQREGSHCDLGSTGYPCSRCNEKGWGASCRNGLPSKEWEVRMLNKKLLGEALGSGPLVFGSGGQGRGSGMAKVMKRLLEEREKGDEGEGDEGEDGDNDGYHQGPQSRAEPRPGPGPRQAQPHVSGDFQTRWLDNGTKIAVESAESVQRRMKRLRGEVVDDEGGVDDQEGHNTSSPRTPKTRRSNPRNNQVTGPQDSRRRAAQNRPTKPPCERCRRLNLRCGEARPCFDCIRDLAFCTDARTNLTYNAAEAPTFNNTMENRLQPAQPTFFQPPGDDQDIYDASPPPRTRTLPRPTPEPHIHPTFFPPTENEDLYNASPPPLPPRQLQQPQQDPWATLQDDASNFTFPSSVPGQDDYLAQINELLPLDMQLNLGADTNINPNINIAPQYANQSHQVQMDRRLQELNVASQSWPVVENELPARGSLAPQLSAEYFGGLSLGQGGRNQQAVDQLASPPGRPINVDPFEEVEEMFDYEAYLNDDTTPVLPPTPGPGPGPASNPNTSSYPDPDVEPEFQDALDRAEQRRNMEAYQRDNLRQLQPPAAPRPRALDRPSSTTTQMFDPRDDAPLSPTSFSESQMRWSQ